MKFLSSNLFLPGGRVDQVKILDFGAAVLTNASFRVTQPGMPVGTPIIAARRGEVVEVNDGYTESGVATAFLDKANAVTVMHEDGTFATYAHLDPGSGVRQGMKVAIGDVLG